MAPSEVAGKHDFVGKVAGGCSSYDVIAPWPDLTRSIFFAENCARFAHKVAQNLAALKTSGGGGCTNPPPIRARGKFRLRTFLKIEWMTHLLYKIEIMLSIQAISKEVHGCAARRVKIYGIPVKLRILPPDVRCYACTYTYITPLQMSGRKMSRSDPIRHLFRY